VYIYIDPREGVHLVDPVVDGRILLRWFFRKWLGMDWIELACDRDTWRALVNALMNLVGNFLPC
jgi:hypothetical protein